MFPPESHTNRTSALLRWKDNLAEKAKTSYFARHTLNLQKLVYGGKSWRELIIIIVWSNAYFRTHTHTHTHTHTKTDAAPIRLDDDEDSEEDGEAGGNDNDDDDNSIDDGDADDGNAKAAGKKGSKAKNHNDDDGDDDGEFFKVKKRTASSEPVDSSRVLLASLARSAASDEDDDALIERIRNCFVTGSWDDDDAAAVSLFMFVLVCFGLFWFVLGCLVCLVGLVVGLVVFVCSLAFLFMSTPLSQTLSLTSFITAAPGRTRCRAAG